MQRAVKRIAAVMALGVVSGCSTPTQAPLPKGLSLAGSPVVADAAPPGFAINALPGGKLGGAGAGAGTGIGAGAVIGAVACLAAGPLAPLCIATVVPTTTAIGGVTGGAVGAMRSESSEAVAFKTSELTRELGATAHRDTLARELQSALNPATSADAPAAGPLSVHVGITEIGTEGKREFGIRLVTRATVLHEGDAKVVHEVVKEVQSEAELTIEAWMAQDARALRVVMQRCLQKASRNIALELTPAPGRTGATGSKYSTSCDDVETDWKPLPIARGPADLPTPDRFAPGDQWEWRQSDNRTHVEERRSTRTVLGSGEQLRLVDDGSTLTIADAFVDGGYDQVQKPWRVWPLEVGRKWTFDGSWHRPDGARGSIKQEVEVVAFEEVTVPAGTFMAYRIQAQGYYRNALGGGARETDTYWWAPDVNCDVKHVRQDDRNAFTRELVRRGPEVALQTQSR